MIPYSKFQPPKVRCFISLISLRALNCLCSQKTQVLSDGLLGNLFISSPVMDTEMLIENFESEIDVWERNPRYLQIIVFSPILWLEIRCLFLSFLLAPGFGFCSEKSLFSLYHESVDSKKTSRTVLARDETDNTLQVIKLEIKIHIYEEISFVIYLIQLNTILKISPELACCTDLEEELMVMFPPEIRAAGPHAGLRLCSQIQAVIKP